MYLKQADVFWGTSREFVKEIMEITTKETCAEGDVLFQEGQAAENFYIMLKGRVKLTIGTAAHTAYIISHAGEAFGWSSLIDRESYSASAICTDNTNLLVIARANLAPILQKFTYDGQIFFKKLAGTLGNRLLQSYKNINESKAVLSTSYGTGQVAEEAAQE